MSTFDEDTGATMNPTEPTLPSRAASFGRDLFERTLATAVEAILAFLAVEVMNLDPVWVPVGTAILAVVKGFLAKTFGNKDSASLDPAV